LQSKNKKSIREAERQHIQAVKELPCIVCDAPPPTECHELDQGQWFTSLSLCADCHRGSFNGIHGQKRIWSVKKLDELSALNLQIERMFYS